MRTVSATFATREKAETAVEHIVQQHKVNRADVFVEPEGSDNSAGTDRSGADVGKPGSGGAPALHGRLRVSVDLSRGHIAEIETVLRELGGEDVGSR
ncbi:hypothetical protein [Phreatobacter cathodiphilus]|uniref:hypothetical protein n=1 Tax=Phreatobacter cathodiphilus TaxID=1868589 RepID=UPI001FE5A6DA|nr:hypothetical protein [Phreatobacter cathodiphilus]